MSQLSLGFASRGFSASHRVPQSTQLEMSWQKCLTFFLIVVTRTGAFKIKDMLCTDEFCTDYIKENGCPPLSEACLAQNSTHNGVYLPFADVCNCCDYCLTNLEEGDACTRGIAGMLPPTAICGPGLACTANNGGTATCQPMLTICTQAQNDWDDRRAQGTLGMTEVRPKCDDDGLYAPAHCIPGSVCYCVNSEGQRIFGEIPFLSSWDEHKMTCGCSINHWKAQKLVEDEFVDAMLTARCNDYGLFEPLQCMMGSKGNCLCVDPITGEPKKDTLVVAVGNLTEGKPACFDPSVHNIGVYETECEILKMKWIEDSTTTTPTSPTTPTTPTTSTTPTTTTTTMEPGVGPEFFEHPQCQPDGKYHRVQTLRTKRICVEPSGKQIENYEADVEMPEEKMNCNCARAKWLLSNAGVTELPSCCPDGSFESWQCRRTECFCVDHNGDQIGVEVDENELSTLACYNKNRPCPVNSPRLR